MKAYPFEEKRLNKWPRPYLIQPKYDGVRCRAIPIGDKNFILVSSEENIIYSVPHINNQLKSLPKIELDGELYTHGMPFEEILSITSRTKNIHPNYEKINFVIFDIVDKKHIQGERLVKLSNYKQYLNLRPNIKIAPYKLANNLTEVFSIYNEYIEEKYEGIIVRNLYAMYVCKRSTDIMKFKPKQQDSYKIISYIMEYDINNNEKHQLGALVCESGDGNVFNVGTGFTDKQRKELWKDKENLIGKTVIINYQHKTSGKNIPRFPVFVDIV